MEIEKNVFVYINKLKKNGKQKGNEMNNLNDNKLNNSIKSNNEIQEINENDDTDDNNETDEKQKETQTDIFIFRTAAIKLLYNLFMNYHENSIIDNIKTQILKG